MPRYVVFVEKTLTVRGSVRIDAESNEGAIEAVNERITSGDLQSTFPEWEAPEYEDESFGPVGASEEGDVDNAEGIPLFQPPSGCDNAGR